MPFQAEIMKRLEDTDMKKVSSSEAFIDRLERKHYLSLKVK